MHPFNGKLPLTPVVLTGMYEEEGKEKVGIVCEDEGRNMVWIGYNMAPTRVPNLPSIRREISLPKIPTHYGKWFSTSIGGVSATVRRTGIVRAREGGGKTEAVPVVLFAVKGEEKTSVQDEFAIVKDELGVTVGDTEYDSEHGYVTEVVVHRAEHVARAACVIARSGGVPVLDVELPQFQN